MKKNLNDGREKYDHVETRIKARNGDMIFGGDILQSVQDTVFRVAKINGEFVIERPEGVYELEEYMSPNLWVIGNMKDNPELAQW